MGTGIFLIRDRVFSIWDVVFSKIPRPQLNFQPSLTFTWTRGATTRSASSWPPWAAPSSGISNTARAHRIRRHARRLCSALTGWSFSTPSPARSFVFSWPKKKRGLNKPPLLPPSQLLRYPTSPDISGGSRFELSPSPQN